MAKMTKAATEADARNFGANHPEVRALTLDRIMAIGDYSERRDWARRLLLTAGGVSADPRWAAEYREGFVDGALGAMARIIGDDERKRANYRRLLGGMPYRDAVAKVREIVVGHNIRGMKPVGDSSSFGFERAWGVGCDLYVTFDVDYGRNVDPDNDRRGVYAYTVSTKITWSSTGRSVAEALASVALYREVVEAAAEIEAVLGHERIFETYGYEDAVKEAS